MLSSLFRWTNKPAWKSVLGDTHFGPAHLSTEGKHVGPLSSFLFARPCVAVPSSPNQKFPIPSRSPTSVAAHRRLFHGRSALAAGDLLPRAVSFAEKPLLLPPASPSSSPRKPSSPLAMVASQEPREEYPPDLRRGLFSADDFCTCSPKVKPYFRAFGRSVESHPTERGPRFRPPLTLSINWKACRGFPWSSSPGDTCLGAWWGPVAVVRWQNSAVRLILPLSHFVIQISELVYCTSSSSSRDNQTI